MFRSKAAKLAAAGFAALSLFAVAVPAAQAQVHSSAPVHARSAARGPASPNAYYPLAAGEAMLVAYANSPLRSCPADSCSVIVYMPVSQGVYKGGGYVTSVIDQNWYNPYCEVNYKNIIGWVGCWRLALP
jgi:hypothetical protein